MSDETENYKVGYKSPPKEHQFRKGNPSANPKGRPKNIKDPVALFSQQLYRRMKITENGKVMSVSALQALVKSMILNDIKKGSDRTLKLYLATIAKQKGPGKMGVPTLVKQIVDDIWPGSVGTREDLIKDNQDK